MDAEHAAVPARAGNVSGGAGRSVTYKDPEELRILAEYWNGFRCDYRYPQSSEEWSGGCRVNPEEWDQK